MTRIDGADLQTACITLSQQKLKRGSHDRDSVPLIPQQKSGCPGQLVGGRVFKRRRGGTVVHRIRGSLGRRDMSLPPDQHKHPVTGLPPIACLTSGDIWVEIGEKDEKELQPMVTESNVLPSIKSTVRVSLRLHLLVI